MEGFRCFTWNKEYFPDPKRMVAELEDGFKTVVIDPGIKLTRNTRYIKALEKDYFCKRADGPYERKSLAWRMQFSRLYQS
jgi:alpha-glucosidase